MLAASFSLSGGVYCSHIILILYLEARLIYWALADMLMRDALHNAVASLASRPGLAHTGLEKASRAGCPDLYEVLERRYITSEPKAFVKAVW